MRQTVLAIGAMLLLAGCASGGPNSGWTARPGAQSYATAHSACQEISYGIEVNYVTCMAGRGWVKARK